MFYNFNPFLGNVFCLFCKKSCWNCQNHKDTLLELCYLDALGVSESIESISAIKMKFEQCKMLILPNILSPYPRKNGSKSKKCRTFRQLLNFIEINQPIRSIIWKYGSWSSNKNNILSVISTLMLIYEKTQYDE